MRIVFETTWLAPGGVQAADGVRVNGQQIVDDADFFRAAASAFYPRGNLAVSLQFVTHWTFNTAKLAEVFALTHIALLPMGPGDLGVVQITCGNAPDTQLVYMNNAVLESARIVSVRGSSVDVEYVIRGPFFQTDVPPDVPGYPDPGELTLVYRRGTVALTNGATSQAIVFSTPVSTTPVVVCNVNGVSGSAAIFGRILSDTVSTTGFTVEFSAAIPDGTYTLTYWAAQ
jgi:hypothetical protein